VFYSSLGHGAPVFWNAPLLAHFLAGIQYVLGDLKADSTPSAKLPAAKK
jgi:type 1 glutamine amidotransferase